MRKFQVTWSKTYIAHGKQVVMAESRAKAEELVADRLRSLTGSIQHDPDLDIVEAYEINVNEGDF
jgi:hypothetical protein